MHAPRLRLLLAAALLLAFASAGCDSAGEEDRNDAERLLGTWSAVSIDTAGGVDLLGLLGSFRAQFTSSSTYRLTATGPDGAALLDLGGTFAVDETGRVITFSAASLARPVPMTYQFESGTAIVLSFPGSALSALGLALDPGVLALISGQEVTAILQR